MSNCKNIKNFLDFFNLTNIFPPLYCICLQLWKFRWISKNQLRSPVNPVNLEWSFHFRKNFKNDFEMKKPYISVNFWLCWHCLTMSVRYQLMANNANRLNRGGIIIDNEENEAGIGFSPCQNSKNCCIFIFLVTVGFIMYLPFIPFSSNKRKFSILTLARFASWRQIFIHESWNTCREWFWDDLELWLSLTQILYLKNFY